MAIRTGIETQMSMRSSMEQQYAAMMQNMNIWNRWEPVASSIPSTPNLTNIPKPTRVEVMEVPVSTTVIDSELADKAAQLFGYSLPQELANEQVQRQQLAQVLNELGIRPFRKADVEQYKNTVLNRVRSVTSRGKWETYKLGDKTATQVPIPEFVLHTAVLLKERLPECEIWVEHLVQVSVPDPFLMVQLGKAVEYVEVWDEADFKGKRVV